jgi:hypothetical protein
MVAAPVSDGLRDISLYSVIVAPTTATVEGVSVHGSSTANDSGHTEERWQRSRKPIEREN